MPRFFTAEVNGDKIITTGEDARHIGYSRKGEDGKLYFKGDSDALLVQGIVALILQVFNGHTPKEILDAQLYFIERIGLQEHLSPTRSNGVVAMIKQIRMFALAYQAV